MRTKWVDDLGKGWKDNFVIEKFQHNSGFILSYSFMSELFQNGTIPKDDDLVDCLEDIRELSLSYL